MKTLQKLILLALPLLLASVSQGAEQSSWKASQSTISSILGDNRTISTMGRQLEIYQLKKGAGAGPRFFIQGGLHGNEKSTSILVLWLQQRLSQGLGALDDLPEGTEIDFLPFANPDNYGFSRYNSNQVNLNRNFSVLWGTSREPNGARPNSESETLAITRLMAARKYHAAVDIHGYINWIVAPSDPSHFKYASQSQINRYTKWLDVLKLNTHDLDGYSLHTAGSLGDGGAFEDWAFWENNSFSFCLEISKESISVASSHYDFLKYEIFIFKSFKGAWEIHSGQMDDKAFTSETADIP